MGFLDEIDEKEEALEEELKVAEEMQYSEPVKKAKVPAHVPVRKERVEENRERVTRHRSRKKKKVKLTFETVTERALEVPALKLLGILCALGMLLGTLYAVTYYDRVKEGEPVFETGDEPSIFLKFGDIWANFLFYIASLTLLYMLLSVQYRKRLKRREDGTKVQLGTKPPKPGPRKWVATLSSPVPMLMMIFLVLAILSTRTYMGMMADDYQLFEDDGHKQVHRANIYSAFLMAFIPICLLVSTAALPSGIKKAGKSFATDNYLMITLFTGIVLGLISFFFGFAWARELFQYYEAVFEHDWLSGEPLPEFNRKLIETYIPLRNLFMLGTFCATAFLLSNLRHKGNDYQLNATPGFLAFALGTVLVFLTVVIDLTLLNTESNMYADNTLPWYVIMTILYYIGVFLLLGALGLLLTEHSMVKRIKAEKLTLDPEELWEQMEMKNVIFRKLFYRD